MTIGCVVRGWTHATRFTKRPITGLVVHNTAGTTDVTTYQSAGGWNFLIGRNGTIFQDVPADTTWAPWHVAAWGSTPSLNRWRPDWVRPCPGGAVSDVNYSALGIELVSAWTPGQEGAPYTAWQYAALARLVADLTRRFGQLPTVGHGELQTDRSDPQGFDWHLAGFSEKQPKMGRIFQGAPLAAGVTWPLQGADYRDPLKGGYDFLDWTDSGKTPHGGADLNAGAGCHDDRGLPVVAPAPGVVRFAGSTDPASRGFGHHVWVEHDTGEWGHFCHLADLVATEGQRVVTGSILGHCGATYGWDCEHTHWEVKRQKPDAWDFWPYNWSQQEVAAAYIDPRTWLMVRGSLGLEPTEMAILTPDERYEVVNNGWQQLRQIGCNPATAIYKAWEAALLAGAYKGLPLSAEYTHAGGSVTAQFFDGGLAVYKDGMGDASWSG